MTKLKSRKIKPTTAIKYNNNSDEAAFLIPYGGTPDDPEYLYPEELEPAVVTSSLSDSRKKQAEKEAATFRNRSLVGHIGGGIDLNMGDKSLLQIASKAIGVPLILTNPVTTTIVPEVGGQYIKTYLNPLKAQTTTGAMASTGVNSYLIAKGLDRNSQLIDNWFNGEFSYSDIPEFGLNFMSAIPVVNTATKTLNVLPKASNTKKPLSLTDLRLKEIRSYINNKLKPIAKQGLEYIKNVHNRYTAPKTNLKPEIYKGDQFQLMKSRLLNGGFEKLGISPEDVIQIPFDHPQYVEPQPVRDLLKNSLYQSVNARQFLLNSEPVPLTVEYPGVAYYSHSSKQFTSPTKGRWGKIDASTKTITGHEFNHGIDDVVNNKNTNTTTEIFKKIYFPTSGVNLSKGPGSSWSKPPGYDKTKIPSKIDRYFRGKNGTELNARLAQLKNWYGITDPNQPITPEMWNYARRHYVNSIGADNNMQQMFRAVTDPKKFLDWINPRVASYTGIVGLGTIGALDYLDDTEQQ